jgi:hypothetical protein
MEKLNVKEYTKKRNDKIISQFQINLRKDHGFTGDEPVIVISLEEWLKYIPGVDDLKDLKYYHGQIMKDKLELDNIRPKAEKLDKALLELDIAKTELDSLRQDYKILEQTNNVLENEIRHHEALFDKNQEMINTMEGTIEELQNKGFTDYLIKVIRNPFKKLNSGKEKG